MTSAELEQFWTDVPECRPTVRVDGNTLHYSETQGRFFWKCRGYSSAARISEAHAHAEVACMDWLAPATVHVFPPQMEDPSWFVRIDDEDDTNGTGPSRLAALMDLCRKVRAATKETA